METSQVMEYARSLYAAHGDKAEAEAAQKAQAAGTPEEADTWKAVRAAIRQLRGPNAS
ncbi:hypothetical protein [Ovoidimarina sediminis]|uniref:hypothetical protein n=1 Tax=Ovoidimarina sediminis TaxID=3079856 RepID=UPI0029126C3E|nr:hypothetical protein [Rhodophyticola sp. MJ-SS7]MDU8944558.1 hypothetical protein [Rhodophyticola sp. MJ-SS7]